MPQSIRRLLPNQCRYWHAEVNSKLIETGDIGFKIIIHKAAEV